MLKIEAALKNQLPAEFGGYEKLRDEFAAAQSHWCAGFRFGNDHGRGHVERVLERLDQLLAPDALRVPLCESGSGTDKEITAAELYVAMVAILAHDLGTARARKQHNVISAELLNKIAKENVLLLKQEHTRILQAVIECHSSSANIEDTLVKKYRLRPVEQIGKGSIRPAVVAALVRIADELDEDSRRAQVWVQRILKLPKTSAPFWEFCQRTHGIRISESREIEFQMEFEQDDIGRITADLDGKRVSFAWFVGRKLAKIQGEIDTVNRHLPGGLRIRGLVISRGIPGHRTEPFSLAASSHVFHDKNPELFLHPLERQLLASNEAMRAGKFADAVKQLVRLEMLCDELPPRQRLEVLYNLACGHNLAGDHAAASKCFEAWMARGDARDWEDARLDAILKITYAINDRDLASIMPRFITQLNAILERRTRARRTPDHSSACVAAETRISTPQGLVMISDIKPGDSVLGYVRENQELVAVRVEAVHRSRSARWRRLNGTLRVTEDHLLLTEDGAFTPACALAVGTRLVAIGGPVVILANEALDDEAPAYDLVLATEPHTYVIDNLVCHNKYPAFLLDEKLKDF